MVRHSPWSLPIRDGEGEPPAGGIMLEPVSFTDLPDYAGDDHLAAWQTFLRTARTIAAGEQAQRSALPPPPELVALCATALLAEVTTAGEARAFFERAFQPFRIIGPQSVGPAFLTGYYEPVVPGSLVPTEEFTEPLFARPADLVRIAPYPTRAEIEAIGLSRFEPVVWLRDAIEVFMIQVQGSAAVDLPDGSRVRLTYAGRNGRPYTSIGRILLNAGEIPESDMSLARLKQWVRDHGQQPGEAGRALLHRNASYIFFALDASSERGEGPIGGAGVPLTPLRSVAVDRADWPYGLPVWVDASLPDISGQLAQFRRLMIGQDTGSAIVGPARLDLFMGSGDAAGAAAGSIRHGATLYILLPRPDELLR